MTQSAEITTVEQQIAQWRTYLRARRAVAAGEVAELEAHLRDQMTALTDAGLTGEEAFLVAVKRMGGLNELSREFAREHSDRLWKQLVIPAETDSDVPAAAAYREVCVVLALAAAAAIA